MERPPKTPMYGEDGGEAKGGGKKSGYKKEGVHDYADNASAHGVYYIFEKDVILISRYISYPQPSFIGNQICALRIFWALLTLGLATLAIYWIVKAYNQWQENKVLTTVYTTGLPIKEIEFPAITICGLGMVNEKSVYGAVKKQLNDYLTSKGGGAD